MDKKQDFWGDLSDVDLEIFAVFCLFVISEIALLYFLFKLTADVSNALYNAVNNE